MEFSTGDYFIFRNWRCAEALKHKKTQAHQVDFYLRRQEVEGGACEPAWAARSACPWGQNWETAVTPRANVLHNLQSYSVSLCWKSWMKMDLPTWQWLNLLQFCSLCGHFSKKCLPKIAGVQSHHHTVSVPPALTKSASSAWHPDIAQPESKKHTNLI